MEKKAIKHERTRLIFAQTARDMIHEGGVGSVSVRKISERAGYSLRTVYNHFKSLDELLWLARDLMIREVARYSLERKVIFQTADDLGQSYKTYIKYFMDHPHVFRFFYFHQLNREDKISTEDNSEEMIKEETIKTCKFIEETGGYDGIESGIIYKTFIYSIHGMIMLTLSGNDDLHSDELDKEIDAMINLFLTRRNKCPH